MVAALVGEFFGLVFFLQSLYETLTQQSCLSMLAMLESEVRSSEGSKFEQENFAKTWSEGLI